MSDRDLARRTSVEVAFAGVDITASIKPYLLSVTYTDSEEDEADDLQIRIQDRDGVWLTNWLGDAVGAAAGGAGFSVSAVFVRLNRHGDGKDTVLDCGDFTLDAVTADGPPSVIAIKATSLPYGAGIRQTNRSRAWESCSLSRIAAEIAAGGGMKCMFESAFDPFYARMEQIDADDIEFLSELCHDAGISLKVTSNMLVLFDQAAYEALDPVFDIRRGDGSYTKWRLMSGESEAEYTSCRVSWTEPDTGQRIEAVAHAEEHRRRGDVPQQLNITAKVGSYEEALALAAKRLKLATKYGLTARFTMPGDTRLLAGVTVTLTDWGMWSGKYIISRASHTVGGDGYVTEIELRQVFEE